MKIRQDFLWKVLREWIMGVAMLVAAGALLAGCGEGPSEETDADGEEEADADAGDQNADAPDAREDAIVPDDVPVEDVKSEDPASPDEAVQDVPLPDEQDAAEDDVVEDDVVEDTDVIDVPVDDNVDVVDVPDAVDVPDVDVPDVDVPDVDVPDIPDVDADVPDVDVDIPDVDVDVPDVDVDVPDVDVDVPDVDVDIPDVDVDVPDVDVDIPDVDVDLPDLDVADSDATPSMENWDLEDWSTSDPPPGFIKTSTSDLAGYTMTQSTQNHTPSGVYSAALTWTTTNTVEILAEYHYPVTAGVNYSCHAWILDNDLAGRARLVLAWYDAGDVRTSEFPATYSADNAAWQELVYQSTAPINTVSMTCGIRLYDIPAGWDGDATVYFDDLSITQP